jgi:hypothetical protein
MAVPQIVRAEHHVVRRLRAAGALSPDTAQPVGEVTLLELRGLARLIQARAVREFEGRVYLDEAAYDAFRAARIRRAVLVLAGVLAVFFALYGLGFLR